MRWSDLAFSGAGTPHPTGISPYQAFFRTITADDCGSGNGTLSENQDERHNFFTLVMGFFLFMGVAKISEERSPDLQLKFELWNNIHSQNRTWATMFALWRGVLDEPIISDIPASDEALVEPFLAVSGSTCRLELPESFVSFNEDGERSSITPFVNRLENKRKNRSFFISPKGYMGLGPLGCQIGDEICVLLGCNQPLLIRRFGDHHLVVGQCYVYGMMHGEMMDEMEAGRLVAETFHFK